MTSTCTHCSKKSCQKGCFDDAPSNCPSLRTTADEEIKRYSENDRETARAATRVEADGYGRLTRVEEIMEYALKCGYSHIGLAFCVGLQKEARTFADILTHNGFKVDSVCCKNGGVSKEALGMDSSEFVDAGCEFEAMCNPAGQAAVLDECGCQLSVILGLCVGHDTLFIKNSRSPVTVLATKDRVLGHNPLAAIYNADSYYRNRLFNYVKNRG